MKGYLVEYLNAHKGSISQHYMWTFNEAIPQKSFGFEFAGETLFDRTLELKRQLSRAASTACSNAKERLADYVIREWGGIRRFSKLPETVRKFDPLSGRNRPVGWDFSFDNISSWSKWLSVICPDWALIYDARVAYSLNAINFLSGSQSMVFPVPSGRNTTMKLLDSETLVLAERLCRGPVQDAKSIKQQHFVGADDAYIAYLDLVVGAHRELWPEGTPLMHTEMLLFSIADTVVFKDLVAFHAARRR